MKSILRHSLLFTFALLIGGCGGGGSGGSGTLAPGPSSGPGPEQQAAESSYLLPSDADSDYGVTVLGDLGTESWAVALNDSGQVTGNYYDASGQVNIFFWDSGSMRPLVASAQAADLNESGQVVGWLEKPAGPAAILYDGGVIPLDPETSFSRAYDINAAGQVVGHRKPDPNRDQAFLDENGQLIFPAPFAGYAARINDAGQVVLQQLGEGATAALLLTDGQLTDLGSLGGRDVYVQDLNESGTVVGWGTTASGEYHAFIWRQGRLVDLAAQIGETFCSAVAVNNREQVLLRATTAQGYRHYLWDDGRVVALENFGSTEASAMDLNDQGQIVGWLKTPAGEIRAFLATPKTL